MAIGLRAGAAANAAAEAREARNPGKEWAAVLACVPLFEGLSPRHLRRVTAVAKLRRYEEGTLIVKAGRPGDAFYVLLDGEARVRAARRTVRLRSGDFFGELALLNDEPRSADVEAADEVLALQIGRTAFTKLLRDEPSLALALLKTLAGRLRDATG